MVREGTRELILPLLGVQHDHMMLEFQWTLNEFQVIFGHLVVLDDIAYGKPLTYSYPCSIGLIMVIAALRLAAMSHNDKSE